MRTREDLIFKGHCITSTYHPTWDKIFGNPDEPATAIVFGERAGKTALRLQMVRHLADYNADHPARVFVIQYADFNPYLDRFANASPGSRRADRVLGQWNCGTTWMRSSPWALPNWSIESSN